MRKIALTGMLLAGGVMVAPEKSFGLAALADGAKTSCKPTAPAGSPLYRTQVNCDPVGVDTFQFSVMYDADLVHFAGLTQIAPYSSHQVFPGTGTPGVLNASVGGNIQVITIAGSINEGNSVSDGHVDVFGANFDLNDTNGGSAADDQPIFFETFAGPGDFVHVIGDSPDGETYTGDQVGTESAFLSMNQIHAVPEPTAVGALGVAAVAALGRRKRTV